MREINTMINYSQIEQSLPNAKNNAMTVAPSHLALACLHQSTAGSMNLHTKTRPYSMP